MKQSAKRMTAFFLMVLLLLSSCAEDTAETAPDSAQLPAADTVDAAAEEETEAETEEPTLSSQLPEADFGGATFYISTFQNANFHYQVDAEELNAVPINDAIWERNSLIEEKYNVVIEQVLYGDGENTGNIQTAIMAGDSTVPVSIVRCGTDLSFWGKGLIYTYDEIPGIDLSQPYWDQGMNESLSICNRQYTAVGAANLDIYDLTFCLLFNKEMVNDHQLTSPYELVEDGTWTFDKMAEYMTIAKNDANGDGVMNLEDTYGYVSAGKMATPGFWMAADVMSIGKDGDDRPYVAFGDEAFLNVFTKIFEVVWDTGASYLTEDGNDVPTNCRNLFKEGNSMFMDMSFFYIEQMRDSDIEFGIIPYPKYTEEQQDVCCRVCYYMPYIISGVCADLEMTGTLMEALHCYSYENVIPVYYDICLKNKNARDEESQRMLDLIFQSRVIDIGDSTLCGQLRDNFMASMMNNNNRDLASTAARYAKGLSKQLDRSLPEDLRG